MDRMDDKSIDTSSSSSQLGFGRAIEFQDVVQDALL